MKIVITCNAPLAHGSFGESAGNATLIRRMAIVSLPGMPRVPVVSGNALRGTLRRLIMRELFATAGASRETIPSPEWDRLYAALANGGHLDGSETRVDPEALRTLRAACPPLSVFGAALYSHLLPGHMDVGILWPRCRETLAAGLVTEAQDVPAEDLVEEISHCRHVDREQQDPAVSGVTPMPTTVEVLATGAVLEGQITFARHATEIEQGAAQHALGMLGKLGGQSARGLGVVGVEYDDEAEGAYLSWLQEHAAASVEVVRAHLTPVEKAPKPKKAKAA
jgi:hypothetical protein